mmetsp:Transcript_55653/g.130273  ORF Transcript_55653/g.130273 Transcript_55653/m.130273 type:complete len:280 (+) Transcript_55653:54-893(+)
MTLSTVGPLACGCGMGLLLGFNLKSLSETSEASAAAAELQRHPQASLEELKNEHEKLEKRATELSQAKTEIEASLELERAARQAEEARLADAKKRLADCMEQLATAREQAATREVLKSEEAELQELRSRVAALEAGQGTQAGPSSPPAVAEQCLLDELSCMHSEQRAFEEAAQRAARRCAEVQQRLVTNSQPPPAVGVPRATSFPGPRADYGSAEVPKQGPHSCSFGVQMPMAVVDMKSAPTTCLSAAVTQAYQPAAALTAACVTSGGSGASTFCKPSL